MFAHDSDFDVLLIPSKIPFGCFVVHADVPVANLNEVV